MSHPIDLESAMRLFISADIEGVAGVVSRDQSRVGEGFEWDRARDWMTGEVTAACEAALAAGCAEVVVCDSHGSGQNIKIERLPAKVTLVRGWPRPLGMMQGVEVGRYVGAMLLGYHSGATAEAGILGHSFKGVAYAGIRLNGRTVSEAAFSAAIAADFGVPILAVSGDDAFVAETRDLLGEVEAATVKWTYGLMAARSLRPQDACEAIAATVTRALGRRDSFQNEPLSRPVELEIDFKHRAPVDLLDFLSCVERRGAFGVRFVGVDMTEVSKFLSFVSRFSSDLT
jgi:D-amino peptidase